MYILGIDQVLAVLPSCLRLLGIVGTGRFCVRPDKEYMTRAGSHMQDRRLGLYPTLYLVDILCCSRSLHEGCNQYLELVVVVAEPVAAETAPDLMAVDT